MIWVYGVTTVPERKDLLQRTLKSLAAGGFERPHLFSDGPISVSGYEYTCRSSPARAYGNWVLAAWELYARQPYADRYAIFQDDIEVYRNLREYLERCEYPDHGYLNLYLYRQNLKDKQGWYRSNQLGKGALGLVFSNEALRTLLSAPHMVGRTQSSRGHKWIDGGIVTAFKDLEPPWFEYVHNPSLIQHTGLTSTLGNIIPGKDKQSATFRGSNFDAMDLCTASS